MASSSKPLHNLLEEHGLPPGLFPKNITSYEFDEKTKKITINMPHNCDVHGNASVLRFSNTVTGYLEKGKLFDIKGMKTASFAWEDVHFIKIKQSNRRKELRFGGKVDKARPFDEFKTPKDGIPF